MKRFLAVTSVVLVAILLTITALQSYRHYLQESKHQPLPRTVTQSLSVDNLYSHVKQTLNIEHDKAKESVSNTLELCYQLLQRSDNQTHSDGNNARTSLSTYADNVTRDVNAKTYDADLSKPFNIVRAIETYRSINSELLRRYKALQEQIDLYEKNKKESKNQSEEKVKNQLEQEKERSRLQAEIEKQTQELQELDKKRREIVDRVEPKTGADTDKSSAGKSVEGDEGTDKDDKSHDKK